MRTSGLDYLLTGIGGSLALYSLGQGIVRPDVGWVFVALFILGTVTSWLLATLRSDSKFILADGFVYCGVALLTGYLAQNLSHVFGENPFPDQLSAAGTISWVLVVGSFVSWRDQTLLFQAVPCIAIFGLVGCYDTFRPAAYLFFGFLLCISTLFARVQSRTMMRIALKAKVRTSLDQEDAVKSVRRGPWRAVAGPEWALGSAGVIVLISFIGAPFIQESVSSVAGRVQVRLPLNRGSNQPNTLPLLGDGNRVGRGPVKLSDDPVLRYTGDSPRYLRTKIYRSYQAGVWSRSQISDSNELFQSSTEMFTAAKDQIKHPINITYSVEVVTGRLDGVPVPGEPLNLDANEDVIRRRDGTFSLQNIRRGGYPPFQGKSVVPSPQDQPVDAVHSLTGSLKELSDAGYAPASVVHFAEQVTKGAKTDFDKAMAIENAISKACTYNQNISPTPPSADPVDYFLFKSHEGYCDLFASSMVLMARSVGIPARYVTGFYPFDNEKDEEGRYIIREKDSHAWAELFFKDTGWVVFDATEGATEAPGSERGGHIDNHPLWQRPWFVSLVSFVVLVLGGLGLRRFAQRYNLRSSLDTSNPIFVDHKARDSVGKSLTIFVQALERKTSVRKLPSQTVTEYLEAVRPQLKGSLETAEALTQTFLTALYSPNAPSVTEAITIRAKTKAFAKNLRRKDPS